MKRIKRKSFVLPKLVKSNYVLCLFFTSTIHARHTQQKGVGPMGRWKRKRRRRGINLIKDREEGGGRRRRVGRKEEGEPHLLDTEREREGGG